MKWSAEYATGVEMIDEHHRTLFKMSEDYRAALDSGEGGRVYGLMLESLDEYARVHFDIEEGCMFRHQCPVAGANANAHQHFVGKLNEFLTRFAAAGFDRSDARQLVDFVDAWLANHIARLDTQLRECIERPSAGRE
jgi:hemerythrin